MEEGGKGGPRRDQPNPVRDALLVEQNPKTPSASAVGTQLGKPPFLPTPYAGRPFLPTSNLQLLKEKHQLSKRQKNLPDARIAPGFFLKCHVVAVNDPKVLDPFGCGALA